MVYRKTDIRRLALDQVELQRITRQLYARLPHCRTDDERRRVIEELTPEGRELEVNEVSGVGIPEYSVGFADEGHTTRKPKDCLWPTVTEKQAKVFLEKLPELGYIYYEDGRIVVRHRKLGHVMAAMHLTGVPHQDPDVLSCFLRRSREGGHIVTKLLDKKTARNSLSEARSSSVYSEVQELLS